VIATLLLAAAAALASTQNPMQKSDNGIAVELTVKGPNSKLVEGDAVDISLDIRDKAGSPLAGLGPNAWIAEHEKGKPALDQRQCVERVAALTAGGVLTQPAVDLNIFHVIVMNADATISVVDPRFSFGGTRLLAMAQLASPGEDWALDDRTGRLFVSMPKSGQVALIDTTSWKVISNLDVGANAGRVALQHDGGYLWVASEAGVAAIDMHKMQVAARIATGKGAHDLALSGDDTFLFVTNADDGTTSIIDVRSLKKTADVGSGKHPVGIGYSSQSETAWVVSDVDGRIFGIDPKQGRVRGEATTGPGISRIRFAPGGRLGFIPNPASNVVHIFDSAGGKVVQTATVEKGPFEITFSDTLAYVRHLQSETVLMLPLSTLGTPGTTINVADFPGGEKAFGAGGFAVSPADGIVNAPSEGAVLVANPADGNIYYYREGMAAPMGHFTNDSHAPRAVLVLDRSLKETKPGVFTAATKLPPAGVYDVAVAVNAPRIVTCFQIAIAENPKLEERRKQYPVLVVHLTPKRVVQVGEPLKLRVRLLDPVTRQPRRGLGDVEALIFRAPGVWQEKVRLHPDGDQGDYTFDFVSPEEGTYYVYLECRTVGLPVSNPQYLIVRATKG
jgi:YVTN family beta-propeller protein